MRTYEEVQAAIDKLRGKQVAGTVSALPPGFKTGCKLSLAGNVVTIGVGMMEIKGTAVKFDTAYQILGEDWVCERIPGGTYYIYIDKGRTVRVDSLEPIWNNTYMAMYHPYSQWRHGGTILTDTVTGKITQNINAEALVAGDIDVTTLETVYAIIAFSEADPAQGSHRVYIDRNEVSLQIYDAVAAAWSTYLKLGGDEAAYAFGTIFPYLQARGLIKTGAITEVNVFDIGDLTTSGSVYDFEDDMADQNGADPWTPAGSLDYEATAQKFGTKSLEATADGVNTIADADAAGATFGADFAYDYWYRIGVPEASYEDIFTLDTGLQNTLKVDNAAATASGVINIAERACISPISSTAIAMSWLSQATGYPYTGIGSISNATITFGSEAQPIGATGVYETGIAALDGTHYVFVSRRFAGSMYAVVGVFSGTTISSHGAEVEVAAATAGGISICALDSTHIAVSYYKTADDDAYARVGVISGTVITFGTEVKWLTGTVGGGSGATAITMINSTSFAVVCDDGATTQSAVGVVTAGDTITFGAVYAVSAATGGQCEICLIDTDKIATIYGSGTGCKVGTIASDDEITWGVEVNPTSSGKYSHIGKLATDAFIVTVDDATDLKIQIGDVAGTTVTLRAEQTAEATVTDGGQIAYLKDNVAVITHGTSATGTQAEVVGREQTTLKAQIGDTNKIKFYLDNKGDNTEYSQTYALVGNSYQHISLQLDFSEDELHFTHNNNASNFDVVYLSAAACALTITLPNADWAIDDLLIRPTVFLSAADSQAHYAANQPWAINVDYDTDLLLIPKDGGKVIMPPEAKWRVKSVSSANYTVTDLDCYDVIRVTTAAADRTITLPTAADNVDRVIEIYKVDSGAGHVIIDGEGAETIQNAHASFATLGLWLQGDVARIYCDGTGWMKLNTPTLHLLDESARANAWPVNVNPTTSWAEQDLSALVPAGTTAVYGFLSITNTDAGGILQIRDGSSAETDLIRTRALQHSAGSGGHYVGTMTIIKATNGIFDVREYAAGNEIASVQFGLWGYYL